MKREKGFSIYELLVVIAIIAIMAALATPNIISWRSEASLKGVVNNLKGDLHLAKMRAIRDNALVAVIFTATGYRVFIDNGVNSGDWNHDGDEILLISKKLPSGVNIKLPTTFDIPNNRLRFNGRGFPDPSTLDGTGLTGTVTIQNHYGQQRQLAINRLGRIDQS
jgi:prepilin-type N-terminal cleavage/methylation domain-containing protein